VEAERHDLRQLHLGQRPHRVRVDRAQPLASPLRADLTGLPPLMIHVGHDEVLRDDSLRLATKAQQAGEHVELRVFPAVPHVWQLLRFVPEARESVAAAARFMREGRGTSAASRCMNSSGLITRCVVPSRHGV
jgi:acetyl esterase/lipase